MSTTTTYRSGVYNQIHEVITNKGGGIASETLSQSTVAWTNFVTHGDNIPGWRELLRTGQPATTLLTGTKTTARVTRAFHRWYRLGAGQAPGYIVLMERSGCGLSATSPSGNPGTISDSKANNAALRKFINKIIEVNQSFQGGVVLGELRETLTSIKNPARALRELSGNWRSRAVKLRDRPNFRNTTSRRKDVQNALADSWLEAQFHWKPLLNDIDSGAKSLAEIATGQSLSTGSVRAESTVSTDSEENKTIEGSSIGSWTADELRVDDCQVIYRGAVRVNARDSVLMAPTLLGFNPASFVPTAWELIPYSFLIDYFTNIGDILAGWSLLGQNLTWCNKTVRKTMTWTRTSRPLDSGVGLHRSSASGSASKIVFKRTAVSRSNYSGNFIPSFELEIPGFGSNKWLNIAALIAGRDEDRRFKFGD